jgi:hypothetical protein
MTAVFATTNRSNLRFISEVVGQWGQTPASGVTREARMVGQSFSVKKSTIKSNELRDDRMVSDIIQTEMMSDGSINFEFSAGAVDDFLQAFMQGTWTRPMTMDHWSGVGVSWASTSSVTIVNQGDLTGYFTASRRVKTEGFINPSNNGYFQVSSTSYSAPTFTINFSTSTGVVEAGNTVSRLSDANDVIILKNGAIRSGTTGASAFDTAGNSGFASAITAGQLNAGQIIYVDGLGYETGTFTFSDLATVVATITVNDGVNSYGFVAGTDFAAGASIANSASNLAVAINTARVLGIGASPGVPATFLNVSAVQSTSIVTVTNLNAPGGTLSDTGSLAAVANFSGGHAGAHGFFTIVSTGTDILTVSPAPTTVANGGSLGVTIKGSMLRNPSVSSNIIQQSFGIETFFQDIAKGFYMDGQMPSTFTLDLNASAILTGSVAFMGRATATLTATKLGAGSYTPLLALTNEIMNATVDVGTLLQNGVALSTAIKSIKLDGKATLRNQMAVSSKFPVGIGTGRLEITGSAEVYFADLTQFNHFLDHDTVSLQFPVFDSRKLTYYFTLPALKFIADPIDVKGIDQDVMEPMSFEAFRDPATACMMQIDRFSSVLPVLG